MAPKYYIKCALLRLFWLPTKMVDQVINNLPYVVLNILLFTLSYFAFCLSVYLGMLLFIVVCVYKILD